MTLQNKTFQYFTTLILVLTFMTACMAEPQVVEVTRVVTDTSTAREIVALGDSDGIFSGGGETSSAPPEPAAEPQQQADAQVQERLIIRTADISLIVSDTETSITNVSDLTNGRGGWVVNSSTRQSGDALRGDMTIRVPAEDFDAALTEIKDSAIEVTRESITGQDVTEEFVDVSARLGNLEATADRVRAFLDETETVEEALQVNIELSRLEGEIESLKGRLQYLSQSAAFSTITITFIPDVLNQPIEVGGWRPQGIARDAIEALIETLQFVASAAIWIVLYVLPVLLIVGLPLYYLGRWLKRQRQARRIDTPPADEPPTESD